MQHLICLFSSQSVVQCATPLSTKLVFEMAKKSFSSAAHKRKEAQCQIWKHFAYMDTQGKSKDTTNLIMTAKMHGIQEGKVCPKSSLGIIVRDKRQANVTHLNDLPLNRSLMRVTYFVTSKLVTHRLHLPRQLSLFVDEQS